MSMTHVATKGTGMPKVWGVTCGHCGVHRLCHHQAYVGLDGLCCHPGNINDIRPGLVPGTMSGSVALQQPGSVFMARALVNTEGHVDDWDLIKYLSPCWSPRAMLPLGP